MQALYAKYPRAFLLAVLLHLVFAIFIVASFDWTQQPDIQEPEVNVVQATAIDEKQVQAELEKLKAIEAKKQRREQDRVDKLEKKADDAKKAREEEQKRLEDVAEKRKHEQEKTRQAEAERKQAEQEAKVAESEKKRLQEEQRQAEVEKQRLEKEQKKASELARKAKEEAERAMEDQRAAEEERNRQQMLQDEQKRLQAERDKQIQGIIQQYQALIKQKVQRNWTKPATAREGMSCDIFVKMMPGGNVLEARVTKSSGDPVFDRSVENAVRRSAPLPLPPDATLFKHFRELEFNFNPKG